MLNDIFETEGGSGVEIHENVLNNSQETNNRRNKFDDLVKEAAEKVYPNCKYNKLSCVVHLRWLPSGHHWRSDTRSFVRRKELRVALIPPSGEEVLQQLGDMEFLVDSAVETVFTRAIRNDDEGHQNLIEESNNLCPGRVIGRKLHLGVSTHKRRRSSNSYIDEKSLTQAQRYVLFNVESVTPFREIGDDGEDGIDITPDMEHEENVEENDNDHEASETQDHHISEMQGGQSNSHESRSEQGAPKKVRGYTQKAETWKMNSTQRIVVTFNKFGKPVGDEGNELVQYIRTLVRMADHVSIEYSDRRKVPMQKKEDMYSLVKVCLIKFDMYPLIKVKAVC
ncbi:hypothetical protein L1987_38431 [Smallanthus sonchifolius]|uniref:Uncharacterized protein n=1 Tax=Smallanthus sonchifolius TaxID=185202 RepID=A0ACB9HJ28_9ASTR|nr:hypothetical protein L1987_38431 [Smallanthus sonchifolius]